MKVHLPYDGLYNAIVIVKDFSSIVDKKQPYTLYIFPENNQERRLNQLVLLAKKNCLAIKVMNDYLEDYPEAFELLKRLVKAHGVELEIYKPIN